MGGARCEIPARDIIGDPFSSFAPTRQVLTRPWASPLPATNHIDMTNSPIQSVYSLYVTVDEMKERIVVFGWHWGWDQLVFAFVWGKILLWHTA